MAETVHNQPPPLHDAAHAHGGGHEGMGIRLRPFVWIIVIFFIAAVIWHVGLVMLFDFFEGRHEKEEIRNTAITSGPLATPDPRLQGIPDYHENTPAQDMAELRKHNAEILNSYGKTKDEGFARIPIDRAMELVVEQKMLPGAAATTQKGAENAKP